MTEPAKQQRSFSGGWNRPVARGRVGRGVQPEQNRLADFLDEDIAAAMSAAMSAQIPSLLLDQVYSCLFSAETASAYSFI